MLRFCLIKNKLSIFSFSQLRVKLIIFIWPWFKITSLIMTNIMISNVSEFTLKIDMCEKSVFFFVEVSDTKL